MASIEWDVQEAGEGTLSREGTPLPDEGSKIGSDVGLSIKSISVNASERIVRFTFDHTVEHSMRKVMAVHIANTMKHTDGLLDVDRRVTRLYPGIEFEDQIVDDLCMRLVNMPE